MSHDNRPARSRSWYGFTLIELLVVISITTMLIALLLPALHKARESAFVVSCKSNLRQVGIAVNAYLSENEDFPLGTRGSQEWGPKGYFHNNWGPTANVERARQFSDWARNFGIAPNAVSFQGFDPKDHGLLVCPGKTLNEATRVWDVSYLHGNVIANRDATIYYGMYNTNIQIDEVTPFYGGGYGPIRARYARRPSALPILFDDITHTTRNPYSDNHTSVMNTLYFDSSVGDHEPNDQWYGGYAGNHGYRTMWYFPDRSRINP